MYWRIAFECKNWRRGSVVSGGTTVPLLHADHLFPTFLQASLTLNVPFIKPLKKLSDRSNLSVGCIPFTLDSQLISIWTVMSLLVWMLSSTSESKKKKKLLQSHILSCQWHSLCFVELLHFSYLLAFSSLGDPRCVSSTCITWLGCLTSPFQRSTHCSFASINRLIIFQVWKLPRPSNFPSN